MRMQERAETFLGQGRGTSLQRGHRHRAIRLRAQDGLDGGRLQRIRRPPSCQDDAEHAEEASRKFHSVIPIIRFTVYIVSKLVVTPNPKA